MRRGRQRVQLPDLHPRVFVQQQPEPKLDLSELALQGP